MSLSVRQAIASAAFLVGATLSAQDLRLTDGSNLRGQIGRVSAEFVTVQDAQGERKVPTGKMRQIDFAANRPASGKRLPETGLFVYLTDGSLIRLESLSFDANSAQLIAVGGTESEVPLASVSAVFRGVDPEKDGRFQEQVTSPQLKADVLLLQKGETVRRLEGAAQSLDGRVLRFVWDGEEVQAPFERLKAVLFYRPEQGEQLTPLCQLVDVFGNRFELAGLDSRDDAFLLSTPSGAEFVVPKSSVRQIRFDLNKEIFLSELTPTSAKETAFFDVVWHYARDRNLRGGPIRLGGREYRRGLSLHSRCRLTYSLRGRYKRFRGLVGIDDSSGGLGHVVCQVLADGGPLFESELKGGEAPRELDLDVTDVKLLTLFVDFGKELDIGDRVAFGDAKLIK